MNPETLRRLELVAEAGIGLVPATAIATHFLFERGGFVVLVERRGEGFGGVGSPGKLVEGHGFAALVRRSDGDWFVCRSGQWPAAPGEAEDARRLFTDLKRLIEGPLG